MNAGTTRDIYAQRGNLKEDVRGVRHYGKLARTAVIVATDGMKIRATNALKNVPRRSVINQNVIRT